MDVKFLLLLLLSTLVVDFAEGRGILSLTDIDVVVGAANMIGTEYLKKERVIGENLLYSLHQVEIDQQDLFDSSSLMNPHRRLQISAIILPENPLLKPSALPTTTPSVTPSSEPSVSPTSIPSTFPSISMMPTSTPSVTPSSTPSSAPSISFQPSYEPTSTPSITPSNGPTTSPSTHPTLNPTTFPSTFPTTSAAPTLVASAYPTRAPITSRPTTSSQPSIMTVGIEVSPILLKLFGPFDIFLPQFKIEIFNDIVDKRLQPFVLRFVRQQYPGLTYIDIDSISDKQSQLIETNEGYLSFVVEKVARFKTGELSKQDIVLLTFELDLAMRSFFDDEEEMKQLLIDVAIEKPFDKINYIERNFSILNEDITDVVNLNEKAGVINNDVTGNLLYDERSKWYVSIALLIAGAACAAAFVGIVRSRNERKRQIPKVEYFPRTQRDAWENVQGQRVVQRNPMELYTTSALDKIMNNSRRKLFDEIAEDQYEASRDIMDQVLSGLSHEV